MTPPEALIFVEEAAIEEELLASTRHDLRNRLAVIRGAASYLKRRIAPTDVWGSEPRIAQFFAQMEEQVDAASALLTERLTVSRPLTRRAGPAEVAECVRAAARGVRASAESAVRIDVDAETAFIHADAAELCVAVRCLLENAIEAMPGGGAATVRARRDGRAVVIDVRDGGEGLSAEASERALEPFFTTKDGHRGLGLNVALRICRRHGGRLEICSLSPGTSVSMSFPISGGERADSAAGG